MDQIALKVLLDKHLYQRMSSVIDKDRIDVFVSAVLHQALSKQILKLEYERAEKDPDRIELLKYGGPQTLDKN